MADNSKPVWFDEESAAWLDADGAPAPDGYVVVPSGPVVADTRWRKSSYSSDSCNCVEVATAAGPVLVRDSKNPTGPVLTFTTEEWEAFVAGVKGGEFGG